MLKTPFFAGNGYYKPSLDLVQFNGRTLQPWTCAYTQDTQRPKCLKLYLPPSHTRARVLRAFEHAIAAHPQEPDA